LFGHEAQQDLFLSTTKEELKMELLEEKLHIEIIDFNTPAGWTKQVLTTTLAPSQKTSQRHEHFEIETFQPVA
jgi:hypothetical protein